jgi:hypothetical protein
MLEMGKFVYFMMIDLLYEGLVGGIQLMYGVAKLVQFVTIISMS